MSNLKMANALRNAMLDEITTYAGSNAVIKVCSGSQPAGGGALTSVLATLTCNATFAAAASSGVLVLNSITADTSTGTGTATWFRIEQSGGTWVLDGDVTVVGGGGDMELNDTAVIANGTLSLTGPNVISAPNPA